MRDKWRYLVGLGLMALSAALYGLHFIIFRDAHHLAVYGLEELAFLPIEVLLVTLIIHRVLTEREKRALLEKLNMIIGVFFSQVGTSLLAYLSDRDPGLDRIRQELVVRENWTDKVFLQGTRHLKSYEYDLVLEEADMAALKTLLSDEKNFLLRLLENPNLLEHETFTELLRAVFHLAEELAHRASLRGLPPSDAAHLANDCQRAYALLVREWLDYMRHLKKNYPFLFSLAMRTNPFDEHAEITVRP